MTLALHIQNSNPRIAYTHTLDPREMLKHLHVQDVT